MRPQSSRDLLLAIATKLRPILSEIAFVGGCATTLLVTDPGAPEPRITYDVDVIVEVASYAGYARLSKRLRALGFSEDASEGAPLCRWVANGMKLDVMPTNETVLGFSNRWYAAALTHSEEISIEDLLLRVVTAPYFIGTKLEAFRGRGRGDFYASRDLEDIIAVIDGRSSLAAEVARAPSDLRRYISGQIRGLLKSDEFISALPGHLPGDEASQARLPQVLRTLNSLGALGSGSSRRPRPLRPRKRTR